MFEDNFAEAAADYHDRNDTSAPGIASVTRGGFVKAKLSLSALLADTDALAPGAPYAERQEPPNAWHDQLGQVIAAPIRTLVHAIHSPTSALRAILPEVQRHDAAMRRLSDIELREHATGLRRRLRQTGFEAPLVGECFALVREAASRTLGIRHYDTQLLAGWGLIQGRLVEMATGEGKTVAATLAASTMALAGVPVHVVTVNDYLAQRDADETAPLYDFLGLSVGAVVQKMSKAERRGVYARAIAYCTNKDLAFDYLRDRVSLGARTSKLHLELSKLRGDHSEDDAFVLRGLYFAIVDEADSVFIDEARTPLILSASTDAKSEDVDIDRALTIANALALRQDFRVDWADRRIHLTETGRDRIEALSETFAGIWLRPRPREEIVTQALSAVHLYRRDEHYVVTDNKVQIVDESTGRIMPDRAWERGLHQLIEAKEGVEATARRETLARITYQRLFPRYLRLSGMTGTGKEVSREIRRTYDLDFVRVPLHRPSLRLRCRSVVTPSRASKWQAVADATELLLRETARPILIGTRSVEASEEISAVLGSRGITHTLLNAKQDAAEADVIAQAGQAASVTVATNIAGRGTDIKLEERVAGTGGLHVILTEYHESRRIDRQLIGRCARQGDPGSYATIISFEDAIFATYAPRARRLAQWLFRIDPRLSLGANGLLRWSAQAAAEARARRARMETQANDRRYDQLLAFIGRGE